MGVDGYLVDIDEDNPIFGAELRLFRKVCDLKGVNTETEIRNFFHEKWKKEIDIMIQLLYKQYEEGQNLMQPEVAEAMLAACKVKSKDIKKFLKRTTE